MVGRRQAPQCEKLKAKEITVWRALLSYVYPAIHDTLRVEWNERKMACEREMRQGKGKYRRNLYRKYRTSNLGLLSPSRTWESQNVFHEIIILVYGSRRSVQGSSSYTSCESRIIYRAEKRKGLSYSDQPFGPLGSKPLVSFGVDSIWEGAELNLSMHLRFDSVSIFFLLPSSVEKSFDSISRIPEVVQGPNTRSKKDNRSIIFSKQIKFVFVSNSIRKKNEQCVVGIGNWNVHNKHSPIKINFVPSPKNEANSKMNNVQVQSFLAQVSVA